MRLTLAVLALLFSVACIETVEVGTNLESVTCQVDSDCACASLCNNGVCAAQQATCQSNTDCAQGESCQPQNQPGTNCLVNTCVPPSNPNQCQTDADCACGLECSANFQCAQVVTCAANTDCGQGKVCAPQLRNGAVCNQNICQPGNTPNSCQVDANCACGFECSANFQCVQVVTCAANTDCGPGEVCEPQLRNGAVCNENICQPGNTPTPCNTDANCACGLECSPNFQCVPSVTCSANTDCGQGEVCTPQLRNGAVCNENICQPGNTPNPCNTDANCACGLECSPNFQCVQSVTCSANTDCVQGEVCAPQLRNGAACNENVCQPGNTPTPCQIDENCACGLECSPNFQCVQSVTCQTHLDCAPNELCFPDFRNGAACNVSTCRPNNSANPCRGTDDDCPCATYCSANFQCVQSEICQPGQVCSNPNDTCGQQSRNGAVCPALVCQ